MTRRLTAAAFLALLSAFFALPVSAARTVSTRAGKALDKTISAGGLFGIPQYTTAGLPACTPLLAQSAPVAYDTTVSQLKLCDGTSWTTAPFGGGVISGTTTCTGCVANAVGFNDGGFVNFADAGLTYNKDLDLITVTRAGGTNLVVGAYSGQTTRTGISAVTGAFLALGGGTSGTAFSNSTASIFWGVIDSNGLRLGDGNAPIARLDVQQTAGGTTKTAVFNNLTSTGNILEGQNNGVEAFAFGDNNLWHTFAGAAVASAAAIVPTGNLFHVTGTTTITSITSTGIIAGTQIAIIFDGILTFTDGSNLVLAGDFVTTANDTITLVFDGTNFYEIGRSAN